MPWETGALLIRRRRSITRMIFDVVAFGEQMYWDKPVTCHLGLLLQRIGAHMSEIGVCLFISFLFLFL